MCGLFGWQFDRARLPSKRERKRMAVALTHHMDDRGGQAWGVWADGRVTKGTGDSQPSVPRFSNCATLMGHTRYATHGDAKNLDHAHPFTLNGIFLSHNGVLSNHRELNTKYGRNHDVDSQHLLSHLVEGKNFDEIEGYGVITFVNTESPMAVNLVKLRDRGDLHIAKTEHGVIWASTKKAITDALEYADIELEFFYEVTPGKLYEASGGGLFVLKTEQVLTVKEPVTYHDWRWGAMPGQSMMSGYGHWFDDDDSAGAWGIHSRPTPPVTPIAPLAPVCGFSADDSYEPDLFPDAEWELEVDMERAMLWLEDSCGITPAAFDGMTPEQVIETAVDMGWDGTTN